MRVEYCSWSSLIFSDSLIKTGISHISGWPNWTACICLLISVTYKSVNLKIAGDNISKHLRLDWKRPWGSVGSPVGTVRSPVDLIVLRVLDHQLIGGSVGSPIVWWECWITNCLVGVLDHQLFGGSVGSPIVWWECWITNCLVGVLDHQLFGGSVGSPIVWWECWITNCLVGVLDHQLFGGSVGSPIVWWECWITSCFVWGSVGVLPVAVPGGCLDDWSSTWPRSDLRGEWMRLTRAKSASFIPATWTSLRLI